MRGLFLGVAIFAALCTAGCAKKDPSLARIEGSEPQRLSFGDPKFVQHAFAEKMKLCWFGGPGSLLAGLRYDLTPAILDAGDGQSQLEQILIYGNGGRGPPVFVVQFHPFNENTLISTRNQGIPPATAFQMKRDVESWIFEREGCVAPDSGSIRDAGAAVEPPRSRWSW